MASSIAPYTDLVTSEHNARPAFMAMVAALVQPLADTQAVVESLPQAFDLDTAVGAQLDVVGLWVGRSRQLEVALENVFFSFDIEGVGFNQGSWKGPYDPTTGLVSLPDEAYRLLLRARIANNHWDGSVPSAYAFLSYAFEPDQVLIQDNCDMSMLLGIVGSVSLDAVTMSLLTRGYLDVKPAGVRIDGYAFPTVEDVPLFGFGAHNESISGFGVGAFAAINRGA